MAENSQANPMLSDYEDLPEAIKVGVSYVAYQWMSDEQKARLIQSETEPEWEE